MTHMTMAEPAEKMEHPVVDGGFRRDSFTPVVARVHGGHLDEGPEYTTFRRWGTTDWLLIPTVSGSGQLVGPDGAAVRTAFGDAVLIRPRTQHDYGTAPGSPRW